MLETSPKQARLTNHAAKTRIARVAARYWPLWVCLAAGALYFAIGWQWRQRGLFYVWDVLFDADSRRVTFDITKWRGNHRRSVVHPLFPLLLLPPGTWLGRYMPKEVAALVLVSLAGAGAVWCAGVVLRRLVNEAEACVLTLLYALSASSLVMFSIVDTFVFSAFGIAATLCFANTRFIKWVCAVCSIGMVTTNVVHVGAAALFMFRGNWRQRIRPMLLLVGGSLVALVVLALVQDRVVPNTRLFFAGTYVAQDQRYMFTQFNDLAALAQRLVAVGTGFFVSTFVAPEPYFRVESGFELRRVTFTDQTLFHSFASGVGVLLVVGLLIWASVVNVCLGRKSPEVGVSALVMAFHMTLVLLYGHEVMLYSPLWCIYLVLWVALALRHARAAGWSTPRPWQFLVLVALLLASNVVVLRQVMAHYQGQVPCKPSYQRCIRYFYKPLPPESEQEQSKANSDAPVPPKARKTKVDESGRRAR